VLKTMFLPGIIAPAAVRYAPLLEHLGEVETVLKDLEVYAGEEPDETYEIAAEVAGIAAAADRAGFERFHLYGHSGGGACALAFAAAHPERLLSLAVDEPATDFSDEDWADPFRERLREALALPGPEAVAAFARLQVAPGVELPPPPPGPPPPWMAGRPAGIAAFSRALGEYRVEPGAFETVRVPVLYTYGSLSNERWSQMRDRLSSRFPDFTAVVFDGLHHMNTSHAAEPERTAELLRDFWARAERA
jgi:pimeloyl-ACP methyl ester carboxylesterase